MVVLIDELPPRLQEQARKKIAEQESKYHARKTTVDGITFDSKGESEEYARLKLLERAGVIQNLKLQPRFLLQEGFEHEGHKIRKIEYVADFQYERDGKTVVEDYKGMRTDVYKLKRKLFLYKYRDVVFREVDK